MWNVIDPLSGSPQLRPNTIVELNFYVVKRKARARTESPPFTGEQARGCLLKPTPFVTDRISPGRY
jgi:hypothetical protein